LEVEKRRKIMANYFKKYSLKESFIAEIWIEIVLEQLRFILKEYENISYTIEKANTGFHDLIIYLNFKNSNSNIKIPLILEIKEEEHYWFTQTGNIGLDLLSAFNFKSKEKRDYFKRDKNMWVSSGDKSDFFDSIDIKKEGKLYSCDADIQLFYCASKKDRKRPILLKAYNNRLLKRNLKYFLDNYDIRINNKSEYDSKTDSWESAVILANPYIDLALNLCEIKSAMDLIKYIDKNISQFNIKI
jgi:hypothetical protein